MDCQLAIVEPSEKFTIDRNGISFNGELTYDEWRAIGDRIVPVAKSIGFIVGDWLNYGETRYGEKYLEAVMATGFEAQTLRLYSYTANRVQMLIRINELDFHHHVAVAKIQDAEDQRKWLEIADRESMSVRRLKKSINVGRVLSPAECKEDPADRGWVTYLALINRLRRWWKQETDKLPLDKWDDERRRVLKHDFKILAEIYDQL